MFEILPGLAAILARQRSKNTVYSEQLGSDWQWDWGWRVHPIEKNLKWHNGIDLPAPMGTPVYCPWPGVVNTVSFDDTNGNYIKITHDPAECEGVQETAYVHLSVVNVYRGESVVPAQIIGEVGSTGSSTGPHLHFIIRTPQGTTVDGQFHRDVDPMPFLESSLGKKIMGASILGLMLAGSVLLYWYYTTH